MNEDQKELPGNESQVVEATDNAEVVWPQIQIMSYYSSLQGS